MTTILDNTWATPLLFAAIEHGVDLSVIACTKYIVGHSDVMLGSVTAGPGQFARLRDTSFALGQTASPDDCWLGSRGLRTMSVRLAQHGASALKIAQWLAMQAGVARVLHPALEGRRAMNVFKRDFKGASGLFSFVLDGGNEASRAVLIDSLKLFGIGYSWGGFESLALPVDPHRHRSVTRTGFGGPVVRLQIGLEDSDDLIADLDQGLTKFRAATT